MYQLVQITDGVKTATLTEYPYALVSYGPEVAPSRASELGGSGPYEQVEDTITFYTIGTTTADAYAAAALVNELLNEAWSFNRWESTTPVRLRVQAQGSAMAPLETLIRGRKRDGPPNLALEVDWEPTSGKYVSRPLTITFVRDGRWLLPPAQTAVSASGNNPSVLTATLPDHDISSPLTVDLVFPTKAAGSLPPSFLIVTDAANKINIYEAEALAAGAFTSVADAAGKARGGSVLRYTPVSTAYATTNVLDITGITNTYGNVGIYAAVRNNSVSATWLLRAAFYNVAGVDEQLTPPLLIDASTTNPRLVFLGLMANRLPDGTGRAANMDLRVAVSSIAGPPTLDIDYFVLVALNDDRQRVLALQPAPFSVFTVAPVRIRVDQLALSGQGPWVSVYKPTFGAAAMSYAGDVALSNAGTAVAVCWLGTGGNAATNWRYADSTGTIVANTIAVERLPAELVPH